MAEDKFRLISRILGGSVVTMTFPTTVAAALSGTSYSSGAAVVTHRKAAVNDEKAHEHLPKPGRLIGQSMPKHKTKKCACVRKNYPSRSFGT